MLVGPIFVREETSADLYNRKTTSEMKYDIKIHM